MNRQTVFALAASLAVSCVSAAVPKGFTVDFEEAKKASAQSGRKIFAVFTGSDWCPWCVKLDKEILSKSEFTAEASKYFELLYLDYPRNKGEMSKKTISQNAALAKKYRIGGFPTVLILDASGAVVAKSGYMKLTPKEYVDATRERAGIGERAAAAPAAAAQDKAVPLDAIAFTRFARYKTKYDQIVKSHTREIERTRDPALRTSDPEKKVAAANKRAAKKLDDLIRDVKALSARDDKAKKEQKALIAAAEAFKASL